MYLDLRDQRPDQVQVIRYGDLVASTEAVVDGVFRFVGLPVTEQTTRFLAECNSVHKDSPYSVYKDKAVRDRWKLQLDPHIAGEIKADLQDTRLEAFLA